MSQHLNQKERCGGKHSSPAYVGGISLSTTGQTLQPRQRIYKQVGGSSSAYDACRDPQSGQAETRMPLKQM